VREPHDGEPPGRSHGEDVADEGNGVLAEGRIHRLVRRRDGVRDRTLEIAFDEAGAAAYAIRLR
jgi:thioredoxin family protein